MTAAQAFSVCGMIESEVQQNKGARHCWFGIRMDVCFHPAKQIAMMRV
jgi:hypothetical protein